MTLSAAILDKSILPNLAEPYEIWHTPFWLRVFVAAMAVVAAILTAFALIAATLGLLGAGQTLQTLGAVATAFFLAWLALRIVNPVDTHRWFRFAVAPTGLYLPAPRQNVLFVPWPAIQSVEVERWVSKNGPQSAAMISVDLDDHLWAPFRRNRNVLGNGRVRRMRVQVADMTGDEICAHIRRYQNKFSV